MTSKEAHNTAMIQPLAKGRASAPAAELVCPPDKSVTHRSVMLAGMAQGESLVVNPLMGADCQSTMGVMRALGVEVTLLPAQGTAPAAVQVKSPGWDAWKSPLVPLDFGNSGTTARLLAGVFAATPGLFVTCFGDGSLSKRPMGRVVKPLRGIGAHIEGRDGGQLLPMAILGQTLRPGEHSIDKATAQVKSALLLAGMNIRGTTKVTLAAGSRDHTEKMLAALGANIQVVQKNGTEAVTLVGPFRPPPRTHHVPGDPSSAAFFAVLAALTSGNITIRGVLDNQTRTGFVPVLEQMGVPITKQQHPADGRFLEPIMDLVIHGSSSLRATVTAPEIAPTLIDEVPILAVAALFAQGTSRLRGLGELRVKESDRFAKVLELLTKAGGKAWAEGDDMLIEGLGERGRTVAVPGFTYDPEEDHRLAMAAAILAKLAVAPCHIRDPQCVVVSFPGFFDALAGIG